MSFLKNNQWDQRRFQQGHKNTFEKIPDIDRMIALEGSQDLHPQLSTCLIPCNSDDMNYSPQGRVK